MSVIYNIVPAKYKIDSSQGCNSLGFLGGTTTGKKNLLISRQPRREGKHTIWCYLLRFILIQS
jgi:hypothetical protein